MEKQQIRLAIAGILGRMGQTLLKVLNNNNIPCVLTSVLDKTKYNNHIKYFNKKIKITSNILDIINDFDVLIDFTNTISTMEYLKICQQYNKKIVIGTTGFNKNEKQHIINASKKISVVWSANFSIGINIINKLLDNISKMICDNNQNNVDINIIEKHHKFKIDSPSGTALYMKNILLKNLHTKYYMKDINCYSIRAGDYYGEHQIIFSFLGENIEIIHQASDRTPFAKGALKSAIWLFNINKNGLYNMDDVLGI
ncbi:4-hydroxy-tetrahydrodipicolinate reductase [Enterobacteriaceae endosymbiont of Neohaemonia nigricornis]|uniref:4-hydroxy-tetrahydrodipicolinate reductase n=1 Tax=Enterobacteriaceae endosymbiont of Neohaemonia nigricornis TaxID=2675792 RepID=UPI00144932E2|nr:4-hydroxy-tetrahydrodipicolinate reductase [Enterobacteriaceae endosymbiont of Neohaemonia nigricornis]QJC30262.1 4-hydroxy-tetrahydrodipicolinate reductase [Enterobacteriaceae endosymbiont of Neohaemonia nigricornis]